MLIKNEKRNIRILCSSEDVFLDFDNKKICVNKGGTNITVGEYPTLDIAKECYRHMLKAFDIEKQCKITEPDTLHYELKG